MSEHTVTVTAVPNMDEDLPDEEYIDTVQFTVECPENGSCHVWWGCKECSDYDPTEDEEDDGEYTRHGVFHRSIDGDWMTESNDCAVTASDSASDSMQEEAENAGLGIHQIDLDYEGDGYWSARRIIPPEERERIEAGAKELHAAKIVSGIAWDKESPYVRDYFRQNAMGEIRQTRGGKP